MHKITRDRLPGISRSTGRSRSTGWAPLVWATRIVSYSVTVIVPCTALYDIPINVAYKTLSKYFIKVLSLVTPVLITKPPPGLSTLHTAFMKLTSKFPYLSQSAKFDVKINGATDGIGLGPDKIHYNQSRL